MHNYYSSYIVFTHQRRKLTSQWTCANDRLVIVLVGLPGRGKSFLCRKLQALYTWRGEECKVFNVGKFRRFAATGEKQDANFFDTSNVEAARIREEVAMTALDELLCWVEGGAVSSNGPHVGKNRTAIFDATNTTRARRKAIMDKVTAFQHGRRPIGTIFVESICDDDELLLESFRYKISTSPDYKDMPEEEALKDILDREQKYKERYEPIDDDSLSYIKIFNFSSKVMSNQIYGDLSKVLVPALMAWHIGDRPIYFCRAGKASGHDEEASFHLSGRSEESGSSASSRVKRRTVAVQSQGLGVQGTSFRDVLCNFMLREDVKPLRNTRRNSGVGTSLISSTGLDPTFLASLLEEGVDKSEGLVSFSKKPSFPCFIMTSTMPRAIETVTWHDSSLPLLTIRQVPTLTPLDKGDFSGMDMEECKLEDPEWFERMEKDIFRTRFPGGESYEDLVSRLETTVIDIEQHVTPVLVVSHYHVIQVLLSYFLNTPVEECASIKVPYNTVIQISPLRGGGWRETRHELTSDDSNEESSEDEEAGAISSIKKAMWGMSVRSPSQTW
jgi:broad specificity phosphatase PhoE